MIYKGGKKKVRAKKTVYSFSFLHNFDDSRMNAAIIFVVANIYKRYIFEQYWKKKKKLYALILHKKKER